MPDIEQTFSEDLESGKIIENEVCKLLKRKYPKTYVVEGYCKEWDIVIPEINKTVEVKQDEKSHFTGNFLVEVEFDGQPSALTTSRADYWIIVDKDHYYITFTDTLRWLINDVWKNERGYRYKPVSFVGDGDIKEKKAYLIPKEKFNNQFIIKVKRKS